MEAQWLWISLGTLKQNFPELRRLDREGIPLDSKNHEDSGDVLQTAAGGGDSLWVIFLNPGISLAL